MSARVVMTSTFLSLDDEAAEAFAGMDVDFVAVAAPTPAELIEATRGADAVISIGEPYTREVIEAMDTVQSITRFGIGVDNVDVPAATEHGIWVTNVPDGNYREVAVHAITVALSVSRRIPLLDASMHETGSASLALAQGTRRPDDQTFGLLGMGRIGRRVVTMARAIGYRVVVFDPVISAADAEELGAELHTFDEVVAQSDILSLHVPYTEANRNMIDAGVIARMPRNAILINVSRGGLVDESTSRPWRQRSGAVTSREPASTPTSGSRRRSRPIIRFGTCRTSS
jgi:D-3-phosphoglycerate dehydrogenase